jgi:queuine/archaeosine tRNA-ribosyltransferase
MTLQEFTGTYGSQETECTIYTATTRRGTYYAVEGSQTVNLTTDEIDNGTNVEELTDIDCFTLSRSTIDSLEDLEEAINS